MNATGMDGGDVAHLSGRCYCGRIGYRMEGEPLARVQCHCRECQYGTAGAENLVLTMLAAGFRYVRGEPARFARDDLDRAVTREFCAACGTQIATRSPRRPDFINVKVGTLDDPAAFIGPRVVVWAAEAQPFHLLPPDVPTFPGFPGAWARTARRHDGS